MIYNLLSLIDSFRHLIFVHCFSTFIYSNFSSLVNIVNNLYTRLYFSSLTYFLSLSSRSLDRMYSRFVSSTHCASFDRSNRLPHAMSHRFRENITTSFPCHPSSILRSSCITRFSPTSNSYYRLKEIANLPFSLHVVKIKFP